MTGQPQYIITEEEVELIEEALKSEPECKPCPYEADGFKQGVASLLRSHPYQSDREILDKYEHWLDIREKRAIKAGAKNHAEAFYDAHEYLFELRAGER